MHTHNNNKNNNNKHTSYMGLCGSKTSDSPVAVQGDEKKGSVDQWMRVLPAPDADLSAIAAALVSKANTDTTLSPPGACCGCLKASGNGCFELRMAAAGAVPHLLRAVKLCLPRLDALSPRLTLRPHSFIHPTETGPQAYPPSQRMHPVWPRAPRRCPPPPTRDSATAPARE